MNRNFGAVFLVAGTCIGSGMIALPMVLAKLGLIPSIFLMVVTWAVMYYTALVNLELNLKAGRGLALGALGRHFSGKTAELIGVISLKLLSYSLLGVFIYGGSSILQKLWVGSSFNTIASYYALAVIVVLLLPMQWIGRINHLLFVGLLGIILVLIVGLGFSVHWSDLPLFSEHYRDPFAWATLIPVVFTSFGFQVIFHTLSNYCHRNGVLLKKVFFWGSFIPLGVYVLWTCSIMSVVYHDTPPFYSQMVAGDAEVGELIFVLSSIAKWPMLQVLVWTISSLAIATSVVGVGIGLFDSLHAMLSRKIKNSPSRSLASALITVVPPYVVVLLVPNAFIKVLGFAGMILAVIAILLPVYLFFKIKKETLYYTELRWSGLIYFSVGFAALVIFSELYTMLL